MDLIMDFLNLFIIAFLLFLVGVLVVMTVGLATSRREWIIEAQGHVLRVENTSLRETLYVDGEIQDQTVGYFAFRARLTGRLPEGGEIKANLGTDFRYHCTIFVDNRLIFSE